MKINFSINYKGYTADISYEPEDKIYVGEVRCISDSLNFHGRSILEVNAMFHQSIENYLDLCKQIGKDPERAADYELACRIYTCISDNTDCTTEPEAVEALREAVLKSGKAGTSAFEYYVIVLKNCWKTSKKHDSKRFWEHCRCMCFRNLFQFFKKSHCVFNTIFEQQIQ